MASSKAVSTGRNRQSAGQQAKAAPSLDRKGVKAENWRLDNVGRLLNNAVRRFEERLIELMADAGHAEIRVSHFSLTRNLDLSGTRLTELAQRSLMTKQAMSELVDQCVALGLVERRPDPADGRARIVTFTRKGLEWLGDCRKAVTQAEREMREEIGTRQLELIKRALRQYGVFYDALAESEWDVIPRRTAAAKK